MSHHAHHSVKKKVSHQLFPAKAISIFWSPDVAIAKARERVRVTISCIEVSMALFHTLLTSDVTLLCLTHLQCTWHSFGKTKEEGHASEFIAYLGECIVETCFPKRVFCGLTLRPPNAFAPLTCDCKYQTQWVRGNHCKYKNNCCLLGWMHLHLREKLSVFVHRTRRLHKSCVCPSTKCDHGKIAKQIHGQCQTLLFNN